jgi:hypothetical protein
MKPNRMKQTLHATLLALAGFTACLAWAEQQTIPFTPQNSSSGLCPGAWTGYARMTNTTDGTIWVQPPTNIVVTSGTLTDASSFPSPYVSIAYVKRQSDGAKWCETNSVTFPATNTAKYNLIIYVKSPLPPPTNTEPMNIQVTWHTN